MFHKGYKRPKLSLDPRFDPPKIRQTKSLFPIFLSLVLISLYPLKPSQYMLTLQQWLFYRNPLHHILPAQARRLETFGHNELCNSANSRLLSFLASLCLALSTEVLFRPFVHFCNHRWSPVFLEISNCLSWPVDRPRSFWDTFDNFGKCNTTTLLKVCPLDVCEFRHCWLFVGLWIRFCLAPPAGYLTQFSLGSYIYFWMPVQNPLIQWLPARSMFAWGTRRWYNVIAISFTRSYQTGNHTLPILIHQLQVLPLPQLSIATGPGGPTYQIW